MEAEKPLEPESRYVCWGEPRYDEDYCHAIKCEQMEGCREERGKPVRKIRVRSCNGYLESRCPYMKSGWTESVCEHPLIEKTRKFPQNIVGTGNEWGHTFPKKIPDWCPLPMENANPIDTDGITVYPQKNNV
jgi:hypothetical protein